MCNESTCNICKKRERVPGIKKCSHCHAVLQAYKAKHPNRIRTINRLDREKRKLKMSA